MKCAFALGCACVLLAAQPCFGQEANSGASPAAGPERHPGFLIGYAVGMGPVSSDPCGDCWAHPRNILDLSHAFHIGWMVNRRLALMVESGGVGTDSADHAFVAAAVQVWLSPTGRVWLKGGLGIGSYVLGDTSNAGSAPTYGTVLGEGGVELVRAGRFTMDLQIRVAATKRPDRWGSSTVASVGFNWYRGWR